MLPYWLLTYEEMLAMLLDRSDSMKVVFKQDERIGVIELHGRLDAYNAPELESCL